MHLNSNKLLFYLLDRWRGNSSTLFFDGTRISNSAPHFLSIGLSDLKSAPSLSQKTFGSELLLTTEAAKLFLRIRCGNKREVERFSKEVEKAWREYNISQLHAQSETISVVLTAIKGLSNPCSYPSACLLDPVLTSAQELDQKLFSRLKADALDQTLFADINTIKGFLSDPQKLRTKAIGKFEQRQLDRWSDFFDNFEKNPLTSEQRLSVIADEDATLVLAGAGSGKTSVITAKAGYLIKAEIRKSHEILLLAFARDAATEMSERIEERCGEPVEARTFHALAYEIIGLVEGGKPALAAHATDEIAFLHLIKNILVQLVAQDSEASKAIIKWFSFARLEEKTQWDFKRKHDFYTYLEKEDLRTLQGEKVKSFEELMIANWLFENGIDYEYEPDYEFDTSDPTKRNYCPDFRLTESGVYLEHFGVRKKRERDGSESLATAPWVDKDEYLEGMDWKRRVHQVNDTTLIETFSYERQEGRLLEALEKRVEPYTTLRPRPREELFDRVVEMNQIDGFVRLLGSFLRNFKSGGYTFEDCEQKAAKAKLGRRALAFLTIFNPVHEAYEQSLGGRIDFEDMVLRAAKYAENGRYSNPFGHILVDEFQDISRSRARLIKALLSQRDDARLFAVGDDWQSIYRFAGSDIHLMTNFGSEFGGEFDGATGVHRIVDLGRTFRSVDKIAYAARRFVCRNPTQLTKTIIPAGNSDGPAIKIVSTLRHDSEAKLSTVLSTLQARAKSEGISASVLLLGRYRKSATDNLRRLQAENPDLKITFKTIHSSKGLEADHVILLEVFSGRTGFPSEIVDDPLLTMVSPEAEPFEHAEERRVMYVAMTRARKTLTIMASTARQSVFVEELLNDVRYEVETSQSAATKSHTCGECEGHLFPVPRKDGGVFYRCEHTDLCGNLLPACASCGTGFPVRDNNKELATCECGQEYRPCPNCGDGWLVERKGRYGRFLGCVKFPKCNGKGKLPPLQESFSKF